MELISDNPLGLTIQEMVNKLNHSKTSVYRIVCSLEEMGYLRKDETSGRFFLTRKMFRIGVSALGTTTIMEHAYEPMRQLRDLLKETVVLGALAKNKVVIMEQILGLHHFSFSLKPGMEVCLHASAPGKVILSQLEPPEYETILKSIDYVKFNDKTITNRKDLEKELDMVKENGYALDWGEELIGVRCIGAPVFNQTGKVIAAVWITGPSDRIPEKYIKDYSEKVVNCAKVISQKIGYRN